MTLDKGYTTGCMIFFLQYHTLRCILYIRNIQGTRQTATKGGVLQSLKIACTECPQHRKCTNKTRLFVNYCGAAPKKMDESSRNAVIECRLRKGYLFKRVFILRASAAPVFPAAAAA
jgi:hypothetical protein